MFSKQQSHVGQQTLAAEAESLAGRSVLVTGASGFLGSAVCARLAALGAQVHAVSRRPQPLKLPLTWWRADLSSASSVTDLLEKVPADTIMHLAGLPDGGRDLHLVLATFQSNALATVNLLAAAAQRGCRRFVYCASMEEPSVQQMDPLPHSPYGASKWVGTLYGRMFHRLYDLPVVIVRTFFVYGPGPQRRQKLVPYVITSLLGGQAPRLSSGSRTMDWIYVDDAADALVASAQADAAIGRVIEVGSGELVSIKTVANQIADIIGNGVQPVFGAALDRPGEVSPVAGVGATFDTIGWKPRTPLLDGLQRTVAWYRTPVS